jgi:hypothetical protein
MYFVSCSQSRIVQGNGSYDPLHAPHFNHKMQAISSRRFVFLELSGDLVNFIARKYVKISLSAMIYSYV